MKYEPAWQSGVDVGDIAARSRASARDGLREPVPVLVAVSVAAADLVGVTGMHDPHVDATYPAAHVPAKNALHPVSPGGQREVEVAEGVSAGVVEDEAVDDEVIEAVPVRLEEAVAGAENEAVGDGVDVFVLEGVIATKRRTRCPLSITNTVDCVDTANAYGNANVLSVARPL